MRPVDIPESKSGCPAANSLDCAQPRPHFIPVFCSLAVWPDPHSPPRGPRGEKREIFASFFFLEKAKKDDYVCFIYCNAGGVERVSVKGQQKVQQF